MKAFILTAMIVIGLNAIDVTNGTVAILEFDEQHTKALFKEQKRISLLKHPSMPQKSIAFVAVPYRQTKPIELLHVTQSGKETFHLSVVQGQYTKEVLSVEPSKVSPPKEAMERIKKEQEEATAIYNTFNPQRLWQSSFSLPLESFITSAYGNARVFNDTLQSYHSGTDFRAAIGTPILATNDGVVVLAKERYYAGGSLIIDHGEGIYSVYFHLNSMDKQVGEWVKKGEVVGQSGATGRITGPHLHFGFMVQGVPIDPLDFIHKVNALF